jgi:hypothetical protein
MASADVTGRSAEFASLPAAAARLSAANATLTASLEQAHADVATLLAEREALAAEVARERATARDAMHLSVAWLEMEEAWVAQRAAAVRADSAAVDQMRTLVAAKVAALL